MPSGAKSYVAVSRNPDGKQVWATIGATDHLDIETAREAARKAIARIKEGLAPVEEKPHVETFDDVARDYLKRHVVAKGLRSEDEIRRLLNVYVLPAWKDLEFSEIRRGAVAKLLDAIEDDNGQRQADYVLAIVRGICNWYAARNEDYVSPIVRGMRRTAPNSRKRERVLTDDEIRALWKATKRRGVRGGGKVRTLDRTAPGEGSYPEVGRHRRWCVDCAKRGAREKRELGAIWCFLNLRSRWWSGNRTSLTTLMCWPAVARGILTGCPKRKRRSIRLPRDRLDHPRLAAHGAVALVTGGRATGHFGAGSRARD